MNKKIFSIFLILMLVLLSYSNFQIPTVNADINDEIKNTNIIPKAYIFLIGKADFTEETSDWIREYNFTGLVIAFTIWEFPPLFIVPMVKQEINLPKEPIIKIYGDFTYPDICCLVVGDLS